MFSNNNKISSRQIKRLLVFELFGTGSLLLPAHLARAGGGMGIWGIFIGTGMACLYLWLICLCISRMQQDFFAFLSQGWGGFFARFLYVGYALLSVLTCAWAAGLLARLMCETLLETRKFPVVLLMAVLLALFGSIAGIEARARVYEILFWMLAVPLAVMLLLCVRQVQSVWWFPLSGTISGSFWDAALRCFASCLPLTFLLFLLPHMQDKQKSGRAAAGALAFGCAALLLIYLILLGIFGGAALAREAYPIITLMGMVKLPGDFLKRLDAVMVGVWFFTLYALIGATLYYGTVILKKAAGAKTDADEKKGRWLFGATAAAVYGIAYVFHLYPQFGEVAEKLFFMAGLPFLVCVPVISVLICKGEQKKENA